MNEFKLFTNMFAFGFGNRSIYETYCIEKRNDNVYTGCIKKKEIKHIVKNWMPFQLHICGTVVREILMECIYYKKETFRNQPLL
jgi:hypothetical protein